MLTQDDGLDGLLAAASHIRNAKLVQERVEGSIDLIAKRGSVMVSEAEVLEQGSHLKECRKQGWICVCGNDGLAGQESKQIPCCNEAIQIRILEREVQMSVSRVGAVG